ncbi:MAG TPA: ABC transporter permease, partial [Blastocatellia bacterium]|nr:ABC transporter permease [Blastocatellia bacterium]
MENLLQDIRFGFRTLVKNPGFTLVAIIALALGTGANSAIFSVVNAVLLRPLPYGDPDRVMMIWGHNLRTGNKESAISVPDFNDYREQNNSFEQLASLAYEDFNLTGGDEPEHIQGTMVSANFFDTLGVKAAIGRTFSPEEGQPGADRVVVISNGLWKRRFGASTSLLGQTISLNGVSFTVIGITPPDFQSPEKGDELWIPMSFDGGDRVRIPSNTSAEGLKVRNFRFLKAVGRLKPNVSTASAQADLVKIAGNLEQQYPNINASISANAVSMNEQVTGKIKPALLILLAAVGFVLLIACANVANLLLARASARQKEIAVRIALGAGRVRLIRQLLTESILLALIGGVLGLLLAFGGIKLLLAINPANIPRLREINIDATVLGFTLLVCMLTGVLFGLIPALQASKPDLNETLKAEGARGSSGGIRKQYIRNIIVISEVALTVLLLIGAGLMIKSFIALQKVSPGFDPDNVLTMQVNLPTLKYTEDTQIKSFYEQVLKRVETLPGVEAAGASLVIPLYDRSVSFRFSIKGRAAPPEERLTALFRVVSPNYFQAMRTPLIQGRGFTDQDRDQSPPVVIINESMRRWMMDLLGTPDENPLGKFITIPSTGPVPREIVGVIADAKQNSLDKPAEAQIYLPYLQKPYPFMGLAVRTSTEPTRITSAVSSAIYEVDPNQPVYQIKTMQQLVDESVSQPRLYAMLIGIFAGVALALAAVGIYGVLNYSVNQRRQEIGIRMALGAQSSDILKMIVGHGMLLTALGLAIGLLA